MLLCSESSPTELARTSSPLQQHKCCSGVAAGDPFGIPGTLLFFCCETRHPVAVVTIPKAHSSCNLMYSIARSLSLKMSYIMFLRNGWKLRLTQKLLLTNAYLITYWILDREGPTILKHTLHCQHGVMGPPCKWKSGPQNVYYGPDSLPCKTSNRSSKDRICQVDGHSSPSALVKAILGLS